MHKTILTFFCLLCGEIGFSQIPATLVEQNAAEIKDRKAANDSVYGILRNYKAVLIGEVHGTQEPPEFLLGLVRSLQKNGKKVVAALEMPSDGLDQGKTFTPEELKKMPAFYGTSPDGRQCVAWAQMLAELQKLKCDIMCFDLALKHKNDNIRARDSLMFANVNEYLREDTSRVLVSLSGNISNMIGIYNHVKTMGYYLAHDKKSCLKGKNILSLNFVYGKGTMHNWMNDGYRVRETDGNAPFYEYATSYDNYLFAYPDPFMKGYNGVLFSKTITASGPLAEIK